MDELFPMMLDEPEAQSCGVGVAYGLFAFFLMPALLSLTVTSALGLGDDGSEIWYEIGYHVINFVVMFLTFFTYLKSSFFNVTLHGKKVFGTAAVCAAVVVVYRLALVVLSVFSGSMLFSEVAFGTLLTTEADLLYYSTAMLSVEPLWGALCVILLTPITTSCLFYASVFAPACTSRPWLGYLLAALVPGVAHLTLVFCLWPFEQQMAVYLVQLPVHLIACWSYQKTDTIWTPIFIHLFANLSLMPLLLWFMRVI